MRFTVQIPAADERFAPDAFDGNIGKAIRVTRADGRPVQGTVVAAHVHPDGSTATVTVEVADGSVPEMEGPPDRPRDYDWSIGYRLASGAASVELAETVPVPARRWTAGDEIALARMKAYQPGQPGERTFTSSEELAEALGIQPEAAPNRDSGS